MPNNPWIEPRNLLHIATIQVARKPIASMPLHRPVPALAWQNSKVGEFRVSWASTIQVLSAVSDLVGLSFISEYNTIISQVNHNIIISRPLINHNIWSNVYVGGHIVIIGLSAYRAYHHPMPVAGPTAKVPTLASPTGRNQPCIRKPSTVSRKTSPQLGRVAGGMASSQFESGLYHPFMAFYGNIGWLVGFESGLYRPFMAILVDSWVYMG